MRIATSARSALRVGMIVRAGMIGLLLVSVTVPVAAQSETAAKPIVGLRRNPPRSQALVDARVVSTPGQLKTRATVLIDGGSIVAVGTDIEIPAEAEQIDCAGKTIYAGLIDGFSERDVRLGEEGTPAGHWNAYVTPQRSARGPASELPQDVGKLRSQGFTVRLVAPAGGIIKGRSCVALLGGASDNERLLAEDVFQHLQLTVPRRDGGDRPRYPNSPMGAVALLRQTLLDANWYRDVWNTYRAHPELPRPELNLALDALADDLSTAGFVIDAPNERMAVRANSIGLEFSLRTILRGSGREYRQLAEIAGAHNAILVPVNFPEPPSVSTAARAREVTLADLMHWRLAPENPARLAAAGASICLTTDGLDNANVFLKRVRTAIARGLDPEAALAAVTTTPAQLFGIDHVVGRVQPGMLANLVITDGDLFAESTKVLETWVVGERFQVEPVEVGVEELLGRWQLSLDIENVTIGLELEFKRVKDGLAGELKLPADDAESAAKPPAIKLKELIRERDRLTATVKFDQLTDQFAEQLGRGVGQLTLVTVKNDSAQPTIFGSLVTPAGATFPLSLKFLGPLTATTENAAEATGEDANSPDEDAKSPDRSDAGPGSVDGEPTSVVADSSISEASAESIDVNYPLGAYGRSAPPERPAAVLFRGGTVWTCDELGKLERGDVLVRDGLIAAIGEQLTPPDGCLVIDASGKHLTPGLIDCHSHMATDGGVNESGQAVTAEVRIGDFIDNSDINIYWQVAGGLTTSNILHGSANPIGGQNQVIKLRWGETMNGLRMKTAPPGIKFALGENVKRSTSRYPNTRMGVEQIIRDQLLAGREYDAKWRRWSRGERQALPPRRDLQLEAIAEIQRGERWIHCHSYRQDEIVATLDLLDEFNIQIGTLQHILEGYKVADRLARHGAMASAFSDWWAYKFEVYDAIPFNGSLMHRQGVVVSFNSDDRELARHLNTEAAKAVKYGGLSEQEALQFVTLNPAKQLRIDDRVGSLAVGKDGDLVVWSGPPLSTTSRCEQTWIEGRKYFDREVDQQLQQRDARTRATLIQMILKGEEKPAEQNKPGQGESSSEDPPARSQQREEDRWLRYDEFCRASVQNAESRSDSP